MRVNFGRFKNQHVCSSVHDLYEFLNTFLCIILLVKYAMSRKIGCYVKAFSDVAATECRSRTPCGIPYASGGSTACAKSARTGRCVASRQRPASEHLEWHGKLSRCPWYASLNTGCLGPGATIHLGCLVLLSLLTTVLDRYGSSWFKDHPLYTFRACGQAGLAQGLLALPSLAIAIFVATRSWWWHQIARLLLASAFQSLFWYAWTASTHSNRRPPPLPSQPPVPPPSQLSSNTARQPPPPAPSIPRLLSSWIPRPLFSPPSTAAHSSGGSIPIPNPNPATTAFFLAAAATGCLISAASARLHAVQALPPASPHLLLPGSVSQLPVDIATSTSILQAALLLATCPALHHLADTLPRSFTPGEAALLVQALLALLAGAVTYLAGAVRQGIVHVLWSPHVAAPDPGMHVPAFCMLVLFWVLMLAVSCMITARCAFTSTTSAVGDYGRKKENRISTSETTITTSSMSSTAGAIWWMVVGDGRRWAALASIAAGLSAVLCFSMLVDLALWVLGRFVAASSRARLATLAYWFSCLAVTVPFMVLVSKASAVRQDEQRQQQGQENGRLEQGDEGLVDEDGEGSSGRERCTGSTGEGGADDNVRSRKGGNGSAARRRQGRETAKPERDTTGAPRDAVPGPCKSKEAASGSDSCSGRQRELNTARSRGDISDTARQPKCGLVTTSITGNCGVRTDSVSGDGVGCRQRRTPSPPLKQQHRLGRDSGGLAAAAFRVLAVPHIVMRKGYHLLAILLFLPAFGWDVRMLQASLAVAGAVLVMLELARCLGPASVRQAICGFMADFADARDSGPLYITHFTLLLGIAVPVWLCESVCSAAAGAVVAELYGSEAASPEAAPLGGGGAAAVSLLSATALRLLPSCRVVLGLSGLVALGSGDTAAACVGFLWGRRRLFRCGKKTWEGTFSGAAAMLASWMVMVWWMDVGWAMSWQTWGALAATTAGVALLEAVTQQLDNVVVPLYYLTHLVLTMRAN